MILINRRLQYAVQSTGVLLFTANSVINRLGELVMGAGAAQDVKRVFPNAPRHFGSQVKHLEQFGVCIMDMRSKLYKKPRQVGAFQVKRDWRDTAHLNMIETSVADLLALAIAHPDTVYHLNYPGIGHGGLTEADIRPLIQELPDNVHIYK